MREDEETARDVLSVSQRCWFTNRTPQEIERTLQQNKQIRLFVAESADEEDKIDLGLDEFITHIQIDSDEIFISNEKSIFRNQLLPLQLPKVLKTSCAWPSLMTTNRPTRS